MSAMIGHGPPLRPVPDMAFGRVCEGFSRAVQYLPAEAGRKLGELLNPKTVFAFVAILALLAGVSLVPIVGPAVDYMVGAYGAVKLGQEFFALFGSVREASEATTTQALEVAAQHIARDLNDAVIDSMLFVAGTAGFRKLRSLLEPLASRFMPASFHRAPSKTLPADKPPGKAPSDKPPIEPGSKEPGERPPGRTRPEEPTLKDQLVGGAETVGLSQGAQQLGHALDGASIAKGLAIAAGITGAVGLAYLALKPKRKGGRSSDGF